MIRYYTNQLDLGKAVAACVDDYQNGKITEKELSKLLVDFYKKNKTLIYNDAGGYNANFYKMTGIRRLKLIERMFDDSRRKETLWEKKLL